MKKRISKIVICGLTAGIGFAGLSVSAEASPQIHEMVAVEDILSDSEEPTSNVLRKKMLVLTSEELRSRSEDAEFQNLVIAKVSSYVNVRSIPDENGEILGKLYNHSVGTFLGEENGWYHIQSGNVSGYVKADYCVVGEGAVELAQQVRTRIATVATQTLFVRKAATTESKIIGMVPETEELVVSEETDGWVKVEVEEGIGWVSADYVTLRNEFVTAESKEEEARRLAKEEKARKEARAAATKAAQSTSSGGSGSSNTTAQNNQATADAQSGQTVADYALQFLGNPYVYGGTSLTKGADCSGFVQSVYANFGVKLPRTSSEQRSAGYAVDGIANAQAGDLVCYSGHIGIYIGDGKIVHASSAKTGIITSRADYRKILAVRRIF